MKFVTSWAFRIWANSTYAKSPVPFGEGWPGSACAEGHTEDFWLWGGPGWTHPANGSTFSDCPRHMQGHRHSGEDYRTFGNPGEIKQLPKVRSEKSEEDDSGRSWLSAALAVSGSWKMCLLQPKVRMPCFLLLLLLIKPGTFAKMSVFSWMYWWCRKRVGKAGKLLAAGHACPPPAPTLSELREREPGSSLRHRVCLGSSATPRPSQISPCPCLKHKHACLHLCSESETETHQINQGVELPTPLVSPVAAAVQLIAHTRALGAPLEQLHLSSNLANPSRALHCAALDLGRLRPAGFVIKFLQLCDTA